MFKDAVKNAMIVNASEIKQKSPKVNTFNEMFNGFGHTIENGIGEDLKNRGVIQ